MSKFSGKTAIVTGASSGIGRATAEALAHAGFTVFGTSRKVGLSTSQVSMLTCDVTNDEAVSHLISTVLAQTGRIDLLVNNAGIGLVGGAEEFSIAQVQALFDVNLYGVIRMTNAVLPSMRQNGQGRIINIGSILGLIPAPYSSHYSAVKHALEGYSESLDHEIRAFGIRVSVVEPGFVRTVFDQNGIEPDSPLKEYDQARAGFKALLADVMPTADLPEVVAAVVLKAASDTQPKHRYTAGKTARQISLMRRFVPAAAFDKSLRKQLRLPV
ncbi:oxidoreductase [Pseudomonas cannabina]|uniref:SDR family NAD(P)-dependent oxidoreductase n=1 Tax=Pseudomonas syringae pv. maculicola str. ES4326 TaxID=629265 RepID=A0A8T8BYN8_PSEYM|nr:MULTISPECIES: oxidoreductase [Pseudomonas syringae group]KPB76502.1 Short chain dehydrogenase [Pseudomonas syringae pv. maculicola]QHE96359.1 SDR family NAD(P)-dependent oxidoreductase [Pseudomonas syringae pv. maculicola str. ES4326]QQN20583.1 oxidoreductase [Pseudomonas cannabina pv. alisalensis]UBY97016.1 oxidoreductase [Pseudomonas cannabina pv. alisalensis]